MPVVKLVVKTNSMQFEDKKIDANAGWNIKELKGKLSELYPTVSFKFGGFSMSKASISSRIVLSK